MLDRFVDWVLSLPPGPTYAVLAALSALENVFPPVPADVAVALGAFLAAQGEVRAWPLGILCWAANQASAVAIYLLARAKGPAFFADGLGRKLVSPDVLQALRQANDRYGMVGIFMSRFLPGLRAAVLPFAGAMGMSPPRALLPAASASALWYFFLVQAGVAFGKSLPAVRRLVDDANRFLGLVALAVTAAVAVWLWRRARRPAAVLVLALGASAPLAGDDRPSVHIRVNQVGYRPSDPKVALALTDQDLDGQGFEVRHGAGSGVALSGTVGRDRGGYGRFAHVYELDFSRLAPRGSYFIRAGEADSPGFSVAEDAHAELLSKSLAFFRVQRCGGTSPQGHGACHLQDGIAKGGPGNGARVRADGGWHDAGDYIKFLITAGYATHLMLATYVRHPHSFPDDAANGVPDVLEEARVGLEWMLKLWDGPKRVLYYQVADASDHDTWRLPERDQAVRPVWACEPGRGANVAGKAAASLALAAVVWSERGRPYVDAGQAAAYLEAARQIYAYGKERLAPQPSNPPDFYGERSFADNLALAAAALHRATGEPAYLEEARGFVRAAGQVGAFTWGDSHALAHYEIARLDPSYVPEAKRQLEAGLDEARSFAEADAFRVGLRRLHWGSAPVMAGVALQAFWYRDLTGDGRYLAVGQSQWDYLLGANPWGVSFVSGAGKTWSRLPHHQIADLTRTELIGFWNEGPVPLSVFEGRKIMLSRPDAYAAFQSEGAVYHDDKEDYVTNEPTLTANATGLSLAAWFVASVRPIDGRR